MNFCVMNTLKCRHFKSAVYLQNSGLFPRKLLHLSAVCPKGSCETDQIDNIEKDSAKIGDKNNAKSEVKKLSVEFRNKLLNGPHLKDFFKNDLFERDSLISNSFPSVSTENPKFSTEKHKNSQFEGISSQNQLSESVSNQKSLIGSNSSSNSFSNESESFLNELEPIKSLKVYFDVYGCQMNVNDTEIVYGILKGANYERTLDHNLADVILIMTCAIRDSAEARIWGRLRYFKGLRRGRPSLKIGLLGCMAERLKERVLEKEQTVDVVAGPDAYRDLPRLLAVTTPTQKSVNVQLSLEETYADVAPVRLNADAISAFVSIMRGCDNMCTYCIVPFTRGRERSRPIDSILREIDDLWQMGVREVTLLGQNVNSYNYFQSESEYWNKSDNRSYSDKTVTETAPGFKTVYKPKKRGIQFAQLLTAVAQRFPELRIRFTSPHPKDFPDDVINAIAAYPNICKSLHMPAQSGSSAVLERMRRGYSREAYLNLVHRIRALLPDVALTSDFICGFCGETDEEFAETVTLMEEVRFNFAYLFAYSMRERTTAHRRFKDDVPVEVKKKRLEQLIELFRAHALSRNKSQIGRTHLVLVEGVSKKNGRFLQGRNDHNTRVILPAGELHFNDSNCQIEGGVSTAKMGGAKSIEKGDYVAVYINDANSQTLKGIPLYLTTLQDFYKQQSANYVNVNSTFDKCTAQI